MSSETGVWVYIDLRAFPEEGSVRTYGNGAKLAREEEVMVGGVRYNKKQVNYWVNKKGYWRTENHLIFRSPVIRTVVEKRRKKTTENQ